MNLNIRNIKGELSLVKNGRPHKFCADCCFIMVAEKNKLVSHYKGHHPDKNFRFLKFDEEP